MENEKKLEMVEEVPVLLEQDVMMVDTADGKKEVPLNDWHPVEKANPDTSWIKDEATGTKKCEKCGAVMRGWASREKFQFCPMCGRKAK